MKLNKVKLKNRRVGLGRKSDGGVCFVFTRLHDGTPEYFQTTVIGKKADTIINISKEAAVSLYFLLQNEITLKDLAAFEKDSGQKLIEIKKNEL